MLKKIKKFVFIWLILNVCSMSIENIVDKTTINRENKKIQNYWQNVSDNNLQTNNYIMILEIPKINLKKGLYAISSAKNNVKYGIQILPESSFYENNIDLLFLAGHSGNSRISYFHNLNQLTIDDEIYIYYKKHKFIYKLQKIYNIEKNKSHIFKKDIKKREIVLITCQENYQVVYVGDLIS